jgi:hypothetical protein
MRRTYLAAPSVIDAPAASDRIWKPSKIRSRLISWKLRRRITNMGCPALLELILLNAGQPEIGLRITEKLLLRSSASIHLFQSELQAINDPDVRLTVDCLLSNELSPHSNERRNEVLLKNVQFNSDLLFPKRSSSAAVNRPFSRRLGELKPRLPYAIRRLTLTQVILLAILLMQIVTFYRSWHPRKIASSYYTHHFRRKAIP